MVNFKVGYQTFLSAQYPCWERDLLSILGAQVTLSPEERPTFRMDTMTYLLSLNTPARQVKVA